MQQLHDLIVINGMNINNIALQKTYITTELS